MWEEETAQRAWASAFPSTLTNMGVRIRIPFIASRSQFLLNCRVGQNYEELIVLPLQQIGLSNEYRRLHSQGLQRISWREVKNAKHKTIYVKLAEQSTYETPAGFCETDFGDCGWIYIQPRISYKWSDYPKNFSFDLLEDIYTSHRKETLLNVQPAEQWRKDWNMIVPSDCFGNRFLLHQTILHFGKTRRRAVDVIQVEEDDFFVILDRQTFWSAFCSLRMFSTPFRVSIKSQLCYRTTQRSIWHFWKDTKSTVINVKDGIREVQLNKFFFLGKQFYIIKIKHGPPPYSGHLNWGFFIIWAATLYFAIMFLLPVSIFLLYLIRTLNWCNWLYFLLLALSLKFYGAFVSIPIPRT